MSSIIPLVMSSSMSLARTMSCTFFGKVLIANCSQVITSGVAHGIALADIAIEVETPQASGRDVEQRIATGNQVRSASYETCRSLLASISQHLTLGLTQCLLGRWTLPYRVTPCAFSSASSAKTKELLRRG